MLVEGGLLHTEGQFGVGDRFDQIHFLPELIDLSCGLAKTHWGRQGQGRDSVGGVWLVRAKSKWFLMSCGGLGQLAR